MPTPPFRDRDASCARAEDPEGPPTPQPAARPLALHELEPPPPAGLDPSALAPPPRFAHATFASYRPRTADQATARDRVAAFAASAGAPRPWRPWRRTPVRGQGMYLDGGFGVGKTHLLAAAWHAAPVAPGEKHYLTFSQLVHALGVAGRKRRLDAFAGSRLVCVDEFELDDPGNTLLVKSFLDGALQMGTHVLASSNTPPGAQGEGRFAAEDFQREIQGIARDFGVLSLDGPDLRGDVHDAPLSSRHALDRAARLAPAPVVRTGGDVLLGELARLHPLRYRGLLRQVGTLLVDDMKTVRETNTALRLVHFIDVLYDLGIALRISGRMPLGALFDPDFTSRAYAKKFGRCRSRIAELLRRDLAGLT